jgi:hypothetical protein
MYLKYLGHPCSVDGDCGPHTLLALNQFQTTLGVAPTTAIDASTVALLSGALPALA